MFVGEFWLNSDLNRFRTKNHALKAYWGCCRVRLLRMLSVVLLAVAFVFGVSVLMLYAGVIRRWIQVVESPFLVLLGLLVVFLPVELGLLLGGLWCQRHRARAFLRHELNRQGVPTCMTCGYDMHGNSSGRCPECNAEFTEHIGSPEPDEAPGDTPRWRRTLALLLVFFECELLENGGILIVPGILSLLQYWAMQRRENGRSTDSG